MPDLDAIVVARLAVKGGLVTEAQLQEAWTDLGREGGDSEPLLRFMERKGYLTSWQSSKLLKGETQGFFVGGYRILYKIASGSFGRVFRAEEASSGRVVAIKVLRKRWTDNAHQVDLFMREGRVGMSLKHPNVVEILSVDKDQKSGQYYIVMEFIEGDNLRHMLENRGKVEPAEALRLIEDATAGLAHAYSKGVTHRDIKLTNILITGQGTAKLVDFGLANLLYASARPFGREEERKVDRTVEYAGLEKATNVKHGDVRSDIYFLGCVLYELLTGYSPLEMTRSAVGRMKRERFEKVQPLPRNEINAPPAVFQLVDSMLTLNVRQRFQTPSQLLDAIRAARRELGGEAKPGKKSGPRTLFIVEKDDRLQGPMRDKFKELGYKVFLAGDPARAVDRFRQNPYDCLIVDAGTTGEDGLLVFDRVMTEAARQGTGCGGVLILSEDQAEWAKRITRRPLVDVVIRPVTMKQLYNKVHKIAPLAEKQDEAV